MQTHQKQQTLFRTETVSDPPRLAAASRARTRQAGAVLGRLEQLLGEIRGTEPAKLVTRHPQDDGE